MHTNLRFTFWLKLAFQKLFPKMTLGFWTCHPMLALAERHKGAFGGSHWHTLLHPVAILAHMCWGTKQAYFAALFTLWSPWDGHPNGTPMCEWRLVHNFLTYFPLRPNWTSWNENTVLGIQAQPIGQLQQMHCIKKQLLQSCFQIGPDDNFCPKP